MQTEACCLQPPQLSIVSSYCTACLLYFGPNNTQQDLEYTHANFQVLSAFIMFPKVHLSNIEYSQVFHYFSLPHIYTLYTYLTLCKYGITTCIIVRIYYQYKKIIDTVGSSCNVPVKRKAKREKIREENKRFTR